MKNHQKHDKLFINTISPPNEVKHVSGKPVGDAGKTLSVFITTKGMPQVQ